MQLLAVLLWVVGWLFTIGLCFDVEGKNKVGWQAIEMIIIWPLILGCFYRVKNEGSENDE
jgi:hypothetical protein